MALEDKYKKLNEGTRRNQSNSISVALRVKVKIFLEQRKVAFLSPSKISVNLNFFYCASLKIQIFANFAG